jgi:hypothetical protein
MNLTKNTIYIHSNIILGHYILEPVLHLCCWRPSRPELVILTDSAKALIAISDLSDATKVI